MYSVTGYMRKGTATALLAFPLALGIAKPMPAPAFLRSDLYLHSSYLQVDRLEKEAVTSVLLAQYQPYEQECFALYSRAQFANKSNRYYIHPNNDIEQLTYIPSSYGRESCSRRKVGTLNSPGVYTIWRVEGNYLVFAQLSGDDKDIMGTRIGATRSSPKPTPNAVSTMSSRRSHGSLIGKSWEIDLGSGKSGLRYLFCNSMRYETQGRSFFGQSGRYSTDGNQLTTRRDDGKVESFNLRWGSGSVDLINRSTGKASMRLYYYTSAKC